MTTCAAVVRWPQTWPCVYMCIHLWDCVHSSSGWWQDHYICSIHFTGNWWLAGIIHWLLWVIVYNSLYCIDYCTSHDSSTGHAMLLQSVHCYIVNILICVRGLTVSSGACLQLNLCFALCTRHLPPSSKMSMLKTGSERISGYVVGSHVTIA